MSNVIVAILVSLSLSSVLGERNDLKVNQDDVKKPMKYFFGDCQAKTGATPSDIETLRMRKIPETKTGLCFLQCIFNTVKIMDDGQFNKHGMVVAFSPVVKGDLVKFGKLKELSEICENEIGTKGHENCKGARMVVECVARHGKEYGIAFPSTKNI